MTAPIELPTTTAGADAVEHALDDAAVRRDGRRAVERARSPEPDEVDRGDACTEAVGERLTDGRPRERVRAEAVHEEHATLVDPGAVGLPVDRVHARAVDVERVRAPVCFGASMRVRVYATCRSPNPMTRGVSTSRVLTEPVVSSACSAWAAGAGTGRTSSVPGSGSSSCVITTCRCRAVTACSRCAPTVLWAGLVCETPGEHWGIALEAFGVALDGPADALPGGDGAEIGVRVPVGLDLEWEVDAHAPFGSVRGEILLARDRSRSRGRGAAASATDPAVWPREWVRRVARRRRPLAAVGIGGSGAGGRRGSPSPSAPTSTTGVPLRWSSLASAPVPLVPGAGSGGPVLVRTLTRARLESPPGSPTAECDRLGRRDAPGSTRMRAMRIRPEQRSAPMSESPNLSAAPAVARTASLGGPHRRRDARVRGRRAHRRGAVPRLLGRAEPLPLRPDGPARTERRVRRGADGRRRVCSSESDPLPRAARSWRSSSRSARSPASSTRCA